MYRIALKMLFGDRAKYFMLASALSFCALLMTQQASVFCGLMLWTTATLRNTDVPVWVMDPNVEQVNEAKPLLDTDLARVRSVEGVAWAVPYYFSIQQARLYDGKFKSIQLIGLDNHTLIGAPPKMMEGELKKLHQSNAVLIDKVGLDRLNKGNPNPLKLGDSFEINDHRVKIVGIVDAARSFFGNPLIYTTYERALEVAPKVRKNLSFILVQTQPGYSPEKVADQIRIDTGLKALANHDFFWKTIKWYIDNTGIPIAYGTTIALGFIVGVAVAGQTFYAFILDNLGNLGALKAMGAGAKLLRRMLVLQAMVVGLIGYGVGLGLASLFGVVAVSTGAVPFYMPYVIPIFTLISILIICMISATIAIRKVNRLEAAEVFRV